MIENDLEAIQAKWLQMCGPCDAGLPTACTHPSDDYRPVMLRLIEEVDDLRDRLVEAEARAIDAVRMGW